MMAQTTTVIFYLAMLTMASTVVTGNGPPSPVAPGPIVNEVMNCAPGLSVCASAFNQRGTPSAECCTAIDTALKTQLTCLCSFIRSPLLLVPFNATAFSALFSQHCGFETDPNLCSKTAAQAPSPQAPLPHGTAPIPGSPKAAEKNVASKLAGTSFVGIVLITIVTIFY